MANTRVQSLFVLTLLQLCRAQGPDNLSESWYLANTITDGHQRKTISEIFSTESPFSETNPILVLPKSTSGPSTIASSTSLTPNSFTRDYTRTFSSSFPSTPFSSTKSPQVEITQYTEQTQPPWQSTADLTSKVNDQSILRQGPPFANSFLAPEDNLDQHQTTQRHYLTSTTPVTFPSSYAIYENERVNSPKEQQSGLFENKDPQLDFVRQPARQPTSTISPRTTRVYGSSTIGSSTWPTRRPLIEKSSTKRPSPVSADPNKYPNTPTKSGYETLPLKIRVVGPKGSITNVNIGQKLVVAPKTTTTKKPTTTTTKRTPKPKKNTYEACLSGCKARRGPICAIPLSAPWLNPDQLKGFPSVCHMACFNSYKKEPYEKLLDGRCGRLKTRIQSFDTGAKLKRDELQKSQYFVDDDQRTVVEVSHLK